MPIRFIAAVFTPLALALGLSWGCTSTLPAPPAPPPVTVTVPAPPPAPPEQSPAPVQQQDSSESGEVEKYEHCRWGDEAIGWMCQLNGTGNGYTDVADDDPRIGPCAGMTWDECFGYDDQSSTGESESGATSESESGTTTSDCTSPDVYDPYQCPGDSELDDGELDSGEIEQSCQFHMGPAATEQELQQCHANY